RPMVLTVQQVPDTMRETRTIQTPNGTVTYDAGQKSDQLSISFEGDHRGQPVWYSAKWLHDLGLDNPVFRHDDGTEIASSRVGDYYLVVPAHFSVIHTFTTSPDGFVKVADQRYSN